MATTGLLSRREATSEEIEGAKVLRSFASRERSANYRSFMRDAYFRISDNGITPTESALIKKLLLKYNTRSTRTAVLADMIELPKTVRRKQHMIDVHVAICKRSDNPNIKKYGKLSISEARDILKLICEKMCVNYNEILTPSRKEHLVMVRQMFCMFVRGRLVDKHIGLAMGRDRTTVIHNSAVAENRLKFDKEFIYDYQRIQNELL